MRRRRACERADDRTEEDRYEVGAGPPDLWDSWSKGLGEVKTRMESGVRRLTPADSFWFGVGVTMMSNRQLGASEGGR